MHEPSDRFTVKEWDRTTDPTCRPLHQIRFIKDQTNINFQHSFRTHGGDKTDGIAIRCKVREEELPISTRLPATSRSLTHIQQLSSFTTNHPCLIGRIIQWHRLLRLHHFASTPSCWVSLSLNLHAAYFIIYIVPSSPHCGFVSHNGDLIPGPGPYP